MQRVVSYCGYDYNAAVYICKTYVFSRLNLMSHDDPDESIAEDFQYVSRHWQCGNDIIYLEQIHGIDYYFHLLNQRLTCSNYTHK